MNEKNRFERIFKAWFEDFPYLMKDLKVDEEEVQTSSKLMLFKSFEDGYIFFLQHSKNYRTGNPYRLFRSKEFDKEWTKRDSPFVWLLIAYFSYFKYLCNRNLDYVEIGEYGDWSLNFEDTDDEEEQNFPGLLEEESSSAQTSIFLKNIFETSKDLFEEDEVLSTQKPTFSANIPGFSLVQSLMEGVFYLIFANKRCYIPSFTPIEIVKSADINCAPECVLPEFIYLPEGEVLRFYNQLKSSSGYKKLFKDLSKYLPHDHENLSTPLKELVNEVIVKAGSSILNKQSTITSFKSSIVNFAKKRKFMPYLTKRASEILDDLYVNLLLY